MADHTVSTGLLASGARAEREVIDESWLEPMRQWLNDPEIASLVMTEPVDAESQRRWYAGLASRTDYAIWGLRLDGARVGAMGLRDIGVDDGGEYFLYLGERSAWGSGVTQWAYVEIQREARERSLHYLYGYVGKHNPRSLRAHVKMGFEICSETDERWRLRAAVAP